jgi:hypothetical protein
MKATRGHVRLVLMGVLLLGITACTDAGVAPLGSDAALLTVAPQGGSVDISVGTSVLVTFNQAIGIGMEAYAALHEGSLTGPEVEGTWSLSPDRTVLTFYPTDALKTATRYVIHLGGGMTDDHGNHVNLSQHGHGLGGEWAMGSMMTGSMGQGNTHMMGSGWAHPANGSYGMTFSFTTAA